MNSGTLLGWRLARRRIDSIPALALGITGRGAGLRERVECLIRGDITCRRSSRSLAWIVIAVSLLASGGVSMLQLGAEEIDGDQRSSGVTGTRAGEIPEGEGAMTYSGTVTQQGTDEPIEGATVYVTRELSNDPKTGNWVTLETTEHETDAAGEYSFSLPPEQTRESSLFLIVRARHPYHLTSRAGGYGHTMIRKNAQLGQPPFFSHIAMWPGEPVTARIVSPSGAPVGGAKVEFFAKAGCSQINN